MMACGLSGEGVVGQATNVLTMAVQNNGLGTRTGGITGRGFLPGQSGNPGGRPKGLAAAARGAVGDDGRDLVAFFSAVMRGDRKALGERRPVALRDRMQAATWLADRGSTSRPASKYPSLSAVTTMSPTRKRSMLETCSLGVRTPRIIGASRR